MSQTDINAALKDFRSLGEKAIQKATARALNKVGTTVRADISKVVREQVALKAADVKDVIQVSKTKGSIATEKQTIEVTILSRAIELFKYGARPKPVKTQDGPRIGVTVKVKTQGPRKLVGQGFIATMRSGKTGIFKRTSDTRLPVKLTYGPSVRDIFRDKGKVSEVLERARVALAKTLRAELNYEFLKKNNNL